MSTQPAEPTDADIRWPVLARLAEQAMSDMDFRAVARHDLAAALEQFGYDLNPRERDLVLRFREALEEAGIDLDITSQFSMDNIELLRAVGEGMLADHERKKAAGND
jgi:hypothetical protein